MNFALDSILAQTISGTRKSTGTGLQINDVSEIVYTADGAINAGDVVTGGILTNRQADPVSLPSYAVQGTAICTYNNEHYMVTTWTTATPYFATYKFVSGAWDKMALPSTVPTKAVYAADLCVFNDELYLALGIASTEYIFIYKMVGGTWEKQAAPNTMPTGNVADIKFCIFDSVFYLIAAHATSPYVSIYKLVSGTWTKFTNPTTLPASAGRKCDLCGFNGSLYAAVSHNSSPYVTTYQLVASAWTKITNPSTLPGGGGYGTSLCVYNNELYLSVSHANTPFIANYKMISGAWSKLGNPILLPESYGNCVDLFVRNTTYGQDFFLSMALISAPYIAIYQFINNNLVKLQNPDAVLSSVGYYTRLGMLGSNLYLVNGNAGSPFVYIHIIQPFKVSTLTGTNISKYKTFTATGIAKANAVDNAEITVYRLRD